MSENVTQLHGGCHCGAVRYKAQHQRKWGEALVAHACNCSICEKVGYLHLIVPAINFRLEQGEGDLSCYTFNSGVAKHYFCRHCGVKPFYIPRSNPDGYSLNARCLDTIPQGLEVEPFDGKNWEKNAKELAHLSEVAKD
ncbi:GFA family protein [Microbulbifer sp. OS29]|uniref:GFA family protein n=1 Tax=Microbulbifer okhotskensis TaxID=2926617 RepID=A0A9X2ES02_9GAMM|nr:GFA family protein [Microbulbifer okhotskensis]MCO1334671.1 GFA family protein [Microbulbifer okhotskensis]